MKWKYVNDIKLSLKSIWAISFLKKKSEEDFHKVKNSRRIHTLVIIDFRSFDKSYI